MNVRQVAFAGTLVVAVLTILGFWYGGIPDAQGPAPQAAVPPPSHPVAIRSLEWTRDGIIAIGTRGGGGPLFLYDAGTRSNRLLVDAAAGRVRCVSLAADRQHLLAGTYDGRLWWIDLNAPASPRKLVELPPTLFTAATVTDDAEMIAAGTSAGSICLCDPSTGTSRVLSPERQSGVADLHFSRDRKWLASAHNDGSVHLWDLTSETALPDFARHGDVARAVAFLPDGERIISAGLDDTVRIWDLARREETWRQQARLLGVNSLAVSEDGSTVAWGGFDHAIVVWNLDSDRFELEIDISTPTVAHLKFSPDGSFLLADGGVDAEGAIFLYDLRRGGEEKRISLLLPVPARDP